MQIIRSLEEYDIALQQPASLLIFSSLKSCKPCRELKDWLETDYTLDLDHIYYIDVFNKNLEEITNEIVALPSVHLYKESLKVSEVDGLMKDQISLQLIQLQDVYINQQIECTLVPDSPTVSVQAIPFVTKSVDDILKELQERLAE